LADYRLLALDLDGTTLLNNKTISVNTIKWIQRAVKEGIIVVFATGRGVPKTEQYWTLLELNTPMVLLNGAEIWKNPGNLLMRHFINHEYMNKLYGLANELEVEFWGYCPEGLVTKRDWTAEMIERKWMKFGVRHTQVSVLEHFYELTNEWMSLEVTKSNLYNLEISNKGITKEYGVRLICEQLGLSMKDVIAIGDSWNDLSLIKTAGLGIAMGNANDDVKRAAATTTDSNEQDGVAKVISQYLLNTKYSLLD
jgi:HAD superfamily hydrolase (TIGR01484 family)